jgi:CHAT domain-containing protein
VGQHCRWRFGAGDYVKASRARNLPCVYRARALLVSHRSVGSAATVKLITSAVGGITRDAKLGRAEALRRAMLALIDNGEPGEAHPAYWAPSIVVSEGAAAK